MSSSTPPSPRPGARDHAPAQPSGLRQSYTPSITSSDGGMAYSPPPFSYDERERADPGPSTQTRKPQSPTEVTSLLGGADGSGSAHDGPYDHGTFSPRPQSLNSSLAHQGDGTRSPTDNGSDSSVPVFDSLMSMVSGQKPKRRWTGRMKSKKMKTSSALAERHGIDDSPYMYLSYYLPVLVWSRQYNWSYFKGDFLAALTLTGMYVPMALSLADNLAHVPAINGLYSFVFNPLIYAILGSCPAMVVGPEAPGALLVGSVIKASVDLGRGDDDDAIMNARICGIVTGIAGATVFAAGIARLGFFDSVLSRPFLRGFISAIGFVISVDQLIPELGLTKVVEHSANVSHGSSVDKLTFIFSNLNHVHVPTFAVAAVSFTTIMLFRELKRRLQPRYPSVAFFPDRFLVVVVATLLSWHYSWDKAGIQVLGKVEAASGRAFTFRWPFQLSHMTHIRDATGTAFLIAMLGFFESSVAAKSLAGTEAFAGIQHSPNRELIALGAANLVGSCFMSLPAFGGYGRSKVNRSTGGKTPMSSVFLSMFTLLCILFVLPYLYYLPKPVLSSLISVVGWSLIEECPHDISFFFRIRAWPELGLMFVIVIATIFYSLTMGIAIGVGLSLLQVIRHATRPRMQILGRKPGTNRFENAEEHPDSLEFIEGCLIVKIPEPLTFANTGALKTRLRRLEIYGTSHAHPALPRLRHETSNRNLIFDIHGVTSMDGSGTQVLEEIVRNYRSRDVRIFFTRGPGKGHAVYESIERSGILELIGGEDHYVADVHDALKLTEVEDGAELGVAERPYFPSRPSRLD